MVQKEKRLGTVIGAVAAVAVFFLAVYFLFPHSVESVLGYRLDASRVGIMMVMSEMDESEYFELDDEQCTLVREILSAVRICRTAEKGNVIHHRDGFGWYQISFVDDNSQTLWPDLSVDSDGDVFIDNVKYEIADEQVRSELLNLLVSICGR